MNKSYRVVFNATIGNWQAVSEVARGRSKSARALALPVLATLLQLGVAHAQTATLPTGGRVVAGRGTVGQTGGTMNVTQATDRMSVDWQTFSVGAGNKVNFLQPSSSSVAFNRVLGADASVIQGAINANGQVFLINPNGVLFTTTSQVNVGSLVATTLGVGRGDPNTRTYSFEGASSNAIVNQGVIQAANGGAVALIAAKVLNTGTLVAPGGSVLLGAGSKATLDLGGPVKLTIEQGAIDALVDNGGAIRADGGTVMLTPRPPGT